MPDLMIRPRKLRTLRTRLALVGLGALAAAGVLAMPAEAHAYPSCGYGIASVSSPWGGFCDGPTDTVGRHYHCQWGMGFELCDYRFADNSPAPAPGFVA